MDKVIFILARFNTERKMFMLSTKHDSSVPPKRDLWALGWRRPGEALLAHRWWNRRKTTDKGKAAFIVKISEKKWTL